MKIELIIPKRDRLAQNSLYKYAERLWVITKNKNTKKNSKTEDNIFPKVQYIEQFLFKSIEKNQFKTINSI